MGTLKGSTNRKTGKTTPRRKAKTHWAGKKSPKRTVKKSKKSAGKKK